jgi:NodT family efflux transporter outer membrane factor (OMF) lipoprotein
LACLLASGCTVGPNFARPAVPRVEQYETAPGPTRLDSGEGVQTIELGRPTDPVWWRLFGSGALNDLVADGLQNSPSLASARAALEQSQDQARAGAGVFYPNLSASFDAARERSTPLRLGAVGPASTFSLYTLVGAISYAVDLFGGERRSVEALNAAADRQRHAAGSAYLLLTGNIVDAAIAWAGYGDQVEALQDIVKRENAQQEILTAELEAGHVALPAVLDIRQQLAADQESLASARQRQAASASLLKTLIGREPGENSPAPPALGDLTVPAEAPVSLPSDLVRQRPDILQAEATLHQASAEVGVATAALFPSISLTGDYGAANTALNGLDAPVARFWSIGPSISVPIFQGGALSFGRKAAQAAYRKAEADYRQTVLAALEQVADSLKALGADAELSAASGSAFEAARLNFVLADTNRQAGVIADYDAITAAIQADRARLVLSAAKAQRLQDVVALYLACGGGWDGRGPGNGAVAVSSK